MNQRLLLLKANLEFAFVFVLHFNLLLLLHLSTEKLRKKTDLRTAKLGLAEPPFKPLFTLLSDAAKIGARI